MQFIKYNDGVKWFYNGKFIIKHNGKINIYNAKFKNGSYWVEIAGGHGLIISGKVVNYMLIWRYIIPTWTPIYESDDIDVKAYQF